MSKHRNRTEHLQRRTDAALQVLDADSSRAALDELRAALRRPILPSFPNPWSPTYAVVQRAQRAEGGRLRVDLRLRSGRGGTASLLITADDQPEHFAAALRLLGGHPPESVQDPDEDTAEPWKAACSAAADEACDLWLQNVLDALDALPPGTPAELVRQVVQDWT